MCEEFVDFHHDTVQEPIGAFRVVTVALIIIYEGVTMRISTLWRTVLAVAAIIVLTSTTALSQYSLEVVTTTDSYTSEPGWQIVNTATQVSYACEATGGTLFVGTQTISVPLGTYEIRGWDGWGDQWQGHTVTVRYAGGANLITSARMSTSVRGSNTCPGPTAVGTTAQIIGTFTVTAPCFVPTITAQPQSQTLCEGFAATFSVTTSMTTGTYEWRKDGVAIPGAPNSNVYTIPVVSTSDAATYDCVLRDACDPATKVTTSASARLTVVSRPTITTNLPANRTICENANDTLRIRATGAGRTFQWFKDGAAITTARDSNFIINNAGATTNGVYTCVVTGTCSPTASSVACSVVVASRPRITQEPSPIDLCPGSSGSISVTATGLNLVYQWYRNGVAVSNAFNSTLTFENYSLSSDGLYYCIVSSNIANPNNCTITAQSRTVRVSGFRVPVVKEQPRGGDVCVASTLNLTTRIEGTGLAYQWYRNGLAVTNADANSLTIPSVTAANAGKYYVVVTGTCGLTVTSDTATVVVIAKPKLTTQPSNKTLEVGQRLELAVDGSDWRSIQWTKNEQPIAGQTSPTFVIESVTRADAGVYNAVVRNSCGGTSSAYAVVTVNNPTIPEPVLELVQTGIDFGEIPVGYDASRTIAGLIKNIGTAPMTVSVLTATPSEFSISNAPALPLTLNPGESQTITIKATPTTKGNLAGNLNIRTNAPASPSANVALTAAYVLRYDHAASEDFGTVMTDTPAERCVRLTNTSALDIAIEQVTFSGMDAGLFTTVTTLPLQIAAGQSGELCVKFAPATAGNKSATLNIRSSNGGNSTLSLSGKGEVPGGVIDAAEAGISAWPNPMTDRVEVRFNKPTPAMNISVVSTSGATVAAFTHDGVEAGGSFRWNGRDAAGSLVASGTYTMIIRYGENIVTIPLTIVK